MRIYEELFIVRPDAPEEEIDAYIEQVKGIITAHQGTVDKVDKWGVRKLAYRIQKKSEGFYVLITFSTPDNACVAEIERRMRVTDLVLKWITVRIDEKLKKLEKRSKLREKRARRRPAPVIAPPAMPAAPAVPGSPAPAAPMPGAPAPAAPAED
jgi:small subunit ribosomal protein S6